MHTGEKAKKLWAYSPPPPIIQPCDGKADDDLRLHLKKHSGEKSYKYNYVLVRLMMKRRTVKQCKKH